MGENVTHRNRRLPVQAECGQHVGDAGVEGDQSAVNELKDRDRRQRFAGTHPELDGVDGHGRGGKFVQRRPGGAEGVIADGVPVQSDADLPAGVPALFDSGQKDFERFFHHFVWVWVR
ncbi:MAG: hypothetical protein QM754_03600 [Tepidisphaeraceae bacterium]